MRLPISLLLFVAAAAGPVLAGPVDFGMAELDAAIAARNFKYKPKVMAELDIQAPETFRIEPYKAGGVHITGGDLRGLMYGLLEAAEQVRSTGRFSQVHGVPSTAHRGVRLFTTTAELKKSSVAEWRGYFAMLARDRFNHFTLVFAQEDPLPSFAEASFELQALRAVLQAAGDYGVEFTLGLWQRRADAAALRSLLAA